MEHGHVEAGGIPVRRGGSVGADAGLPAGSADAVYLRYGGAAGGGQQPERELGPGPHPDQDPISV